MLTRRSRKSGTLTKEGCNFSIISKAINGEDRLVRAFMSVIVLCSAQQLNTAYAATISEPIDLMDMAKQADSVVVGTPMEAYNKLSSEGNLFTEVMLSDAQALNNGQFQYLDNVVPVYIWGGVRDANGNAATLDSPPPHIVEYIDQTPMLEMGTPHLFFFKDNGLTGMPFQDGGFGVYKVMDSGNLLSSDQKSKVMLVTDESGNTEASVQSMSQTIDFTDIAADSTESFDSAESLQVRDATMSNLTELLGVSRPEFVDPLFQGEIVPLNPIFVE